MTGETTGHVLVVDDDTALRECYRELLTASYTVTTAASGEEALDRADGTVDLVLLDRELPGRSGAETLAALRSRGLDPAALFVSGRRPDDLDVAYDDYIRKPADPALLCDRVDALFARTRCADAVDRLREVTAEPGVLEDVPSSEGRVDGEEQDAALRRLEALSEGLDVESRQVVEAK